MDTSVKMDVEYVCRHDVSSGQGADQRKGTTSVNKHEVGTVFR